MHYFVTGHTGFKGSWLILLLKELGHEVSGYSLKPAVGGLFDLAGLESDLKHHFIGDIRDLASLKAALKMSKPDFAIHMAAQALVLRSYEDPIETYTTNVDGTRNFLEAISNLEAPPVTLVVTTDKVYRDDGKGSYVESDPLGGHDPYSASKAMADILTQSWAATNPRLRLHIARAGNVVGAFDVSSNRLIPDAIRAGGSHEPLIVRSPEAVRPWQHVLDCLTGYLLFLKAPGNSVPLPIALNFGPDPESIRSVAEVLIEAKRFIPELSTTEAPSTTEIRKETQFLTLDSSMANSLLQWRNYLAFDKVIEMSFASPASLNARRIAEKQVKMFLDLGVRTQF